MRTKLTLLAGLVLLIFSCKPEDITPVETPTEHVVGTPVGGIPFVGESTFTVFIEGEEFIYSDFQINYLVEEDEDLGIMANALLLEEDSTIIEMVQLVLPFTTIEVGEHPMKYVGPFQVFYYHDELEMNAGTPEIEGNTLTITAYDSAKDYVSGHFTTSVNLIDLDGSLTGTVVAENISGEFGIYY